MATILKAQVLSVRVNAGKSQKTQSDYDMRDVFLLIEGGTACREMIRADLFDDALSPGSQCVCELAANRDSKLAIVSVRVLAPAASKS